MHLTRLAVDHLRGAREGRWLTDDDARMLSPPRSCTISATTRFPTPSKSWAADRPARTRRPALDRGTADRSNPARFVGRRSARVANIIDPDGAELPPADRLLRGVLSGALDMDKLDYLPRDARACNVPYGGVDTADSSMR